MLYNFLVLLKLCQSNSTSPFLWKPFIARSLAPLRSYFSLYILKEARAVNLRTQRTYSKYAAFLLHVECQCPQVITGLFNDITVIQCLNTSNLSVTMI